MVVGHVRGARVDALVCFPLQADCRLHGDGCWLLAGMGSSELFAKSISSDPDGFGEMRCRRDVPELLL